MFGCIWWRWLPSHVEQSSRVPRVVGQSLFRLSEARLEVYVDDPLVASKGSTDTTHDGTHHFHALVVIAWTRSVKGQSPMSRDVHWFFRDSVSHVACRLHFPTTGQHRHCHVCQRLDGQHSVDCQDDRFGTTPHRCSLCILGSWYVTLFRSNVVADLVSH